MEKAQLSLDFFDSLSGTPFDEGVPVFLVVGCRLRA